LCVLRLRSLGDDPGAMTTRSDEELMELVQGGDIAAFEDLVDRFKSVVYSLAMSMLRSREDAEEAAQDTFVKLFRARDQFERGRSLEPWLLRIAGNTCRDALRRRKVDRASVASLDPENGGMEQLVDQREADESGKRATRDCVRRELESLSDSFRLPLVLKYVNGFTNRQIADSLGISVSNVKVRVARAKDVLQSRLERVLES
jgi:RNA polymerase sigma factor (sigma-70 family)